MAQKPAPHKIMNRDMAKSAYSTRSQNFVLGMTQWLLVVLILSLGFGQLLRFDLYGLPLYFHDVLIVSILVIQSYRGRNFIMPPGLKIFVLGLALGWLRAFTLYPVQSLMIPSLYTFRLLAYLVLYFSLKASKVKLSIKYFYLSAFVSLCIGLLQYFLLPDMRIFQYLGWDDHLSRMTLPHFDPTFTAAMLGLFLLTLKRSQWFIGFMVVWSILLTYARSVWISLVLTGLFFLKSTKYLLLTFTILLLAIVALPRRFGEGTNLLRTFSISSRITYDWSYVQKYNWDLLVGRGLNTSVLDTQYVSYPNHATGPNNSYLYLLLNCGILGLAGWSMFMYSIYHKSKQRPMLIFFFTVSLFNNVMFYPFALIWVLLLESMAPTAT